MPPAVTEAVPFVSVKLPALVPLRATEEIVASLLPVLVMVSALAAGCAYPTVTSSKAGAVTPRV